MGTLMHRETVSPPFSCQNSSITVKGIVGIFALCMLFCGGLLVQDVYGSTEYSSTDVPKTIPDPETTTSSLLITDTGTLTDLNVKLNISHSWDSDLDVFLIAPDSTRIELFTDVGASGDNFSNTVLDDEASTAISSGSAPFAGSYRPEGNLSNLDGKSITGTWTLEVTDDDSGVSGTLNSWSLLIETNGGGGDGVVTYHAVVCGIENYQGTLYDLNYCHEDADGFRYYASGDSFQNGLLSWPNWDSENITLLKYSVTKSQIQTAIQNMCAAADEDDVCVFFFAGHGTAGPDVYPYDEDDWPYEDVDEYLVTYDGLVWDSYWDEYYVDFDKCIRDDEFGNWMADLPTDKYAVFLDACNSGGQIRGLGKVRGIGDIVPVKGDGFAADLIARMKTRDLDDNYCSVVVTACDDDETCEESYDLKHGVFTYCLLQGMGGSADDNYNDRISAEECYYYARPCALNDNPAQYAQMYDGHPGELEFLVEIEPICCPTTITSYPYTESFESDFGDWVNSEEDDIDWTRHTGSTLSSDTGPSAACEGAYYLYTEASDSGYPNKQATLESPCFNLSSLNRPELHFCYHMYGGAMGTLTVEVSEDECASWTPVWSLSGNQGDSWLEAVIDLSAYSGSTVKVRFIGVTGASYASDMAIDYVIVAEGELDAPVLHAEPNITPGLRNTISWDPEADADGYYAQCANDANFANTVTGSGWISETNCTFTGLELGQTYWYRVKATPQFESWSQTSQAEFQTDTLIDTIATADGNVVLAGGGAPTVDTVGDSSLNITTTEGYLNCCLVTTETTLMQIEVYLGISTSVSIEFVVYEGGALFSDQYNRIHSSTLGSSGTGTKFYISGPISVHLEAGKHYIIGAVWSGSVSMYYSSGHSSPSFGSHVGFGYYNGFPSPSTLTDIAESAYTFYHRYTTVQGSSYADSGSIISTSINLPADGNWAWAAVCFDKTMPSDTALSIDVLNAADDSVILADVASGTELSGIAATSIKLRANLSTDDPNNTPALHDWSVSYVGPCESDWSNVESSLQCDTLCDFDDSNEINFIDFAILAGQWLQVPGSPSADIAPEVPNNLVDFLDLSVFVENWLLDLTCTVEN